MGPLGGVPKAAWGKGALRNTGNLKFCIPLGSPSLKYTTAVLGIWGHNIGTHWALQ